MLEHARNGSLGAMFDHVGIAVSDLAVSERFYRSMCLAISAIVGIAAVAALVLLPLRAGSSGPPLSGPPISFNRW